MLHAFAKRNAMQIIFDEAIDPNSSDFRSQLVKARGVNVFFVTAYAPSRVILIMRQLRELGIEPDLLRRDRQ